MKPLAQLVEEYLRHLSIERGLAKNTVAAYRRDLSGYLLFLEKNRISTPVEITEETVTEYLRSIAASGALASNSVARMLAGVRGLHKFWLFESITSGDPSARVKPPKLPKRLPKAISVFDVEKLIDASGPDPEAEDATALDMARVRNRAILELLYATGARISELTALNLDDLLDPTMIRLFGKGSKERVVPV